MRSLQLALELDQREPLAWRKPVRQTLPALHKSPRAQTA